MDPATLVTFALALGIAVATPGPGMAAVVARALGTGFLPTLPMVAGLVLGDIVYLSFAAFGLSLVAQQFGALFLVVKWAGAAYLLYMAWSMWTAPAKAPELARPGAGSPWHTFLVGLSVTLGNPKVIVFYLALLPTLIDLESLTPIGFAELVVLVVAILAAIATAYAALAARARALFRSVWAVRLLNRSAAAVMAGAAASIATRS